MDTEEDILAFYLIQLMWLMHLPTFNWPLPILCEKIPKKREKEKR